MAICWGTSGPIPILHSQNLSWPAQAGHDKFLGGKRWDRYTISAIATLRTSTRPLQFVFLVRSGHFHAARRNEFGKCLHDLLFAVDEKRRLDPGDGVAPRQQTLLIGMGGKPADRMDLRLDRDVFTEEADRFRAADDLLGGRALRSIADKNHACFRAPKIVLEMV